MDVAALRAAALDRARARGPGPRLAAVADLAHGETGVRMRLYRPAEGSTPLVVFVHGGGWVVGSLETHERTCRLLAASAQTAVLAVDVRNAPEHPWPAAVDDAVAAVRHAAGHREQLGAEGRRLAVAGDSSGGLVAALACLRLRDEGGPLPDGQLLAYPNADLTLGQASVRTFGSGFGLDASFLEWCASVWVPDGSRRADPAVSPLFAQLAGLPPALVVTAGHDPLRDEGDAFAERLRAAGVAVEHRCEPGLRHGFLQSTGEAESAAAGRFFAAARAFLHAPP